MHGPTDFEVAVAEAGNNAIDDLHPMVVVAVGRRGADWKSGRGGRMVQGIPLSPNRWRGIVSFKAHFTPVQQTEINMVHRKMDDVGQTYLIWLVDEDVGHHHQLTYRICMSLTFFSSMDIFVLIHLSPAKLSK